MTELRYAVEFRVPKNSHVLSGSWIPGSTPKTINPKTIIQCFVNYDLRLYLGIVDNSSVTFLCGFNTEF